MIIEKSCFIISSFLGTQCLKTLQNEITDLLNPNINE